MRRDMEQREKEMLYLRQKTGMNALITGATKGIGRAITERLADEGYDLLVCARNATELEAMKADLEAKYPVQVHTAVCDCAKEEDIQRLIARSKSLFKEVNVLVHNAGLYRPGKVLEEGERDFQDQLQVNVLAPYSLTRGLLAQLKSGNHVFMICSIAGLHPVSHAPSYSVSKMALLGLSRVMREELRERGVKLTAILPGETLTESWKGTDIPADRFVQAEDVAAIVWSALNTSKGAVLEEIIVKPLNWG